MEIEDKVLRETLLDDIFLCRQRISAIRDMICQARNSKEITNEMIAKLYNIAYRTQRTLKTCPEIMRLANMGEKPADLLKLSHEDILIRWINCHLEKAGQELRIHNLGKDLADSQALLHVLNQLDKNKCSLQALNENDILKRAK